MAAAQDRPRPYIRPAFGDRLLAQSREEEIEMPWRILMQSDVEPYETVMRLLGEAGCELDWWREPEPPPGVDYGAIEGIYVYSHMWVSKELMARCPKLRIVSNFGVGCDHIDLEGARSLGLPVGNTPGVLDAATADLTWTLLLAAARNAIRGDHFARGPEFTYYDAAILLGQQVTGAALGIVGLGRIGYQVARRAAGFDMEILYHNRNRNERAERELGARYLSLDELLEQSDFVTLNCPLTEETRGLIGSREIERMKPAAVLVNAARGPVWDQEAVLEALRAGATARGRHRRDRPGAAAARPPPAGAGEPGDLPAPGVGHPPDPGRHVDHVRGQPGGGAGGPGGAVPDRVSWVTPRS